MVVVKIHVNDDLLKDIDSIILKRISQKISKKIVNDLLISQRR